MQQRWPDEWYIDGATKEKTYDYFPGGRHGNNFMSEDIAFCMKAKECGFDLWAMQGITMQHVGTKTWESTWALEKAYVQEIQPQPAPAAKPANLTETLARSAK